MGVYIPDEILKIDNLNMNERVVLSKYKYFTEDGKYKCCSLTCEQIADELNMSVWYLKKIKKHLKELGYIRTSGIKVFYLGVQGDTIVPTNNEQGCTIVHSKGVPEYTGGVPEYTQECTIVHSKGVPEYTHKKEEKEKEIKKEEKWVTNIKLLFSKLPKDYHTPERLNYIKDTYKERLNEVDFNDGSILDTWIPNIKNELNKAFPVEFLMKKEEPKVDFIDVF